ncbi:MAG: type II toxin-antitoxin system RelE/ParE family toxin [Bacteroidota bacterium]|nr:type II toxin-antitoxin system RelE/ParE family toxin [Bacteroidota bacterium]
MAEYKLTKKAVEDLSKIWDYTYRAWSENQADKYYCQLLEVCQELVENHNLGSNYNDIGNEVLGCKSREHIIFYRILNNKVIEITRFLHIRIDLKNRIQE